MFYANGYHATSIAAIAAEAGRTIGAVYSNFDGKEALCLEVLKNRLLAEMATLFEVLVTAGESLEARLEALSTWWSRLSTETSLVILTAEYLTSTFNDEDRVTNNREVVKRIKEAARALLQDTLPDKVPETDPRVDDAVDALVSTGIGLSITQAMGVVGREGGAAADGVHAAHVVRPIGTPPEASADQLADPLSGSVAPCPVRCGSRRDDVDDPQMHSLRRADRRGDQAADVARRHLPGRADDRGPHAGPDELGIQTACPRVEHPVSAGR